MKRDTFRHALFLSLLVLAAPARAELPAPVREMVEAALATGDPSKVATIIEIAKETNPADAAELDGIEAAFLAEHQRLAAAAAAEKAAAEEQALRSAGVFENWSGSGEIGASRSTGNNDNVGLSVGLRLDRKGIDWQHLISANADFQRSNGTTTREKYVATYEPRYNLSSRAFLFGIGQFERNPFQGFSARYALSTGVGYRVFDGGDFVLSIKAGPAWRHTEFVAGGSESSIAALAAFDFDWAITDRLKLTQDMNMLANAAGGGTIIVEANNTSINLVTGLEAKVSDRLTTRFAYTIDHDSDPPAGKVKTDTLSRVTLVYGF